MSQTLHIQLAEETKRYMAGLKTQPERIIAAVKAGMDKANQLAIANIQQNHLTGQGPFPASEHKLGVRTSRLRGSVNAVPTTESGGKYNSAIGSNVVYAAIHELGGTIHHKARSGSVRLRTDKAGKLFRQPGHPHLAMFARASHKNARPVKYDAAAHDVEMPARAPFITGLRESAPVYKTEITRRVLAAMP